MSDVSQFDASASLIGYLHQLRYALWQAIESAREDLLGRIAIESADDVELISVSGHRIEQLKHRDVDSSLTDRSSDLWKTLRIWSSLFDEPGIDLSKVSFRLITTGFVASGSIGSLLSPDESTRDVTAALAILRNISTESSNEGNRKAYKAFRDLGPQRQELLLQKIQVIAQSPNIETVRTQLERSLAIGMPRHLLSAFVDNLEGWWVSLCIEKLMSDSDKFIELDQLDAYIQGLRDDFSATSLPISQEIANLQPAPERFQNHIFVKQLRFIEVNERRINRAITNYLRAFNQRSSWQRQNLIMKEELKNYERQLIEEWELHFDQLHDVLGAAASEEAKLSMARELYSWAEGAAQPVIRERCTEAFVVRGSLQMLAHEKAIGWHPEFAAKLMALFEPEQSQGAR
ncbi:hypothetical protein SAMN04487917_105312 [Arthrobacter sp. yr096]|uniref:ABC-three component system protein n=1 Tax=Arthrobacter sp. yr096 TaxID=1761750 RepID=UPI0008C00B76|nr:ABC-three component system protein [Arthrobacter sp. yr096]SEJ39631.1 hypothetical protein SAMN04487917_105312 [Arthrobacter sp. yr096]